MPWPRLTTTTRSAGAPGWQARWISLSQAPTPLRTCCLRHSRDKQGKIDALLLRPSSTSSTTSKIGKRDSRGFYFCLLVCLSVCPSLCLSVCQAPPTTLSGGVSHHEYPDAVSHARFSSPNICSSGGSLELCIVSSPHRYAMLASPGAILVTPGSGVGVCECLGRVVPTTVL